MIGTLLQDRYRLDTELGRGGMGIVYRAHDTLLDRDVAIKVLNNAGLGSEGRARLLHEAQTAARLNHPNIVSVYDAGEAGTLPFIVTELVEGESLHIRPIHAVREIISVARQLCAALDHAHNQGIIHRDLKPENVLISNPQSSENQIRVKLMDFGLARSRSASRLTQEGALVGTAFYLSPEQALGGEVDGRADLYSLGVMLYEWVTSRLPFNGDDPLAVISQHLHAPVVAPHTFRPDLPPALEAIILRLLHKSPDERFATAGEVDRALAEVIAPPTSLEPLSSAGVLEQLAGGRLVGRREELRQLRHYWARAQQGHGHMVLISGEPGVGKTRLASELMVAARLSGALVLSGGCYEYEAATPYLPFVEALRGWVHDQDPERLRSLLDTTAPEVARLAPEIEAKLGPIQPNPTLSPGEERLRLFDSVAGLFQRLAVGRGLLLFVDDLHWADQGTLGMLYYLLRRMRRDPVLVLAAYREVELDRAHPLAAALVEWNRERLATRLALARLSLDETSGLLASLFQQEDIAPEFAEAVFRETEGNPFFIEEVVKALVEQGEVYREAGRWQQKAIEDLAIPQSVKEAIGRRLNRLSPACIEMLHAAAALGKSFVYAELAAIAGIDENRLLDALDEATSAQLIRPESGETFVFTHDKIREVLYEELNPIRRRRLHQRAGESLERVYQGQLLQEHIQDLAYHFLQGGDFEKGLHYAQRAAERAGQIYAPEEALGYYQQALECAEALSLPEPDQIVSLNQAIGDLQVLRGFFYEAVDAYQRALALAGTRAQQAALKVKIGVAYGQPGDERGLEFLQAAQKELDPGTQTDELADTLIMLGRYHHYRAQHRQAIAYFERARELAEPLDHPLTLTYLYAYLAGAFQHLAQYDESMRWARQCIAVGERHEYPGATAIGYEFLAEDWALIGKWEEAIEFARLDREIGERIGSHDRQGWSAHPHALSLYGQGRLEEALAAIESGLALARHIGEHRLMVWLDTLLAFVEADLGLDEAAAASAESAQARADDLGQVALQCWSLYARAYLHIQSQEWEEALILCDRGAALYTPTDNRISPLFLGLAHVKALWGAGRLAEAADRVAEYLALARETKSLHYEGMALRLQGGIAAAQGADEEALRAFEAAITRLEELGSRLELGRALAQRALWWQAQGQAERAQADAARARAIFETCGARRDLEQMPIV